MSTRATSKSVETPHQSHKLLAQRVDGYGHAVSQCGCLATQKCPVRGRCYCVSSTKFDRFPVDGRLYRLIATGRRYPSPLAEHTRRVMVYLAEMEELTTGDAIYARRDDGSIKFLVIDEAVGSIPSLILGSFWRDRTIQPDDLQNWVQVRDAALPEQTWQLTSLGTLGFSTPPSSDCKRFPLAGTDAAGQRVNLAGMPVLHGQTASGLDVYIPCYEIFRRFFGVTTELANALMGGRWANEVGKLVNLETTKVTDEGNFEIEPLVTLSNIACRAIALFQTSPHALTQAAAIYVKIFNALRGLDDSPWIEAWPPWKSQEMCMSFMGEPLPGGGVLALWIHDAQFPKLPYPITRLTQQVIPKSEPEAPTGPAEPAPKTQPDEDDPPVISRPQDVRPIGRALHIGIQDTWSDLEPLSRRIISTRTIPYDPSKPKRKRTPPTKRVGTGVRSGRGGVPPGSLSSEDQLRVEDRFRALAECLELMVQQKHLLSFTDYGLVNPVETPSASYCALPANIGGVDRAWAVVEGRPRMCWVVELIRADGQRFYWLETESRGDKHHRALLLRMQENASLPAATLDTLLKQVVLSSGVWRPEDLAINHNAFTTCTVNHRYGMVKPSLVLEKMQQLAGLPQP